MAVESPTVAVTNSSAEVVIDATGQGPRGPKGDKGDAGVTTTGKTVWVDAEYGSDSTGTTDRADKPFATLAAAKAAAVSGETIVVRPGTYAGTNFWKNGITWYCEYGAVFTAPTGDTPFIVGAANESCVITGRGRFTNPTNTNANFCAMSGANASLTLECQEVSWTTTGVHSLFNQTAAGTTITAKIDKVTSSDGNGGGDLWTGIDDVAFGRVRIEIGLALIDGVLTSPGANNFNTTNNAVIRVESLRSNAIILAPNADISVGYWQVIGLSGYLHAPFTTCPPLRASVISGPLVAGNSPSAVVRIAGAHIVNGVSVSFGRTVVLQACRLTGTVTGTGTLVNYGSVFNTTPTAAFQQHGTLTDLNQLTAGGAATGNTLAYNGTAWAPAVPSVASANITDATARGRVLLTAATALACRDAIGSPRVSNPRDYGAFADGSSHPITAPEIAALPAGVQPYVSVGDEWDFVALQWSALVAFGNATTGVWNGLTLATQNRAWYIAGGDYLINKTIVIRDLCGGIVFGDGQFASSIRQQTPLIPSLRVFACAKSFFHNIGIEAIDLTNDGVPGINSNNNLQTNSLFRMGLSGGGSAGCGYGLRIDGRTMMGSENSIVECDIGGAWDIDGGCTSPITNGNHSTPHPAAGVVVLGQNALQNTIYGGNISSCRKGVYTDGGSVSGYHPGFQNYQNPPTSYRHSFDTARNADFPVGKYGNWDVVSVNSGVFEVDQWQGCRSESFRCVYARQHPISVRGWTCAGWAGQISPNYSGYQVGDLAIVVVNGIKRLMQCTQAGTTGANPNADFAYPNQPFAWNYNLATATGTTLWNMADVVYFDIDDGSIDDISADGGGVILRASGTAGVRIGRVRQSRSCHEAYRSNDVTPITFSGLSKPQRTTPHLQPPFGVGIYLTTTPADAVTVDATGGAQTVYMPKASTRDQLFVNITGANAVTLQAYSGDTVTGSGTGLFVSDGVTAWVKV